MIWSCHDLLEILVIQNFNFSHAENLIPFSASTELFEMVNKEEFCELVNANNELNERMKAIYAERSKWKQTAARLKPLSKEFERLADLVKCLDKKCLL